MTSKNCELLDRLALLPWIMLELFQEIYSKVFILFSLEPYKYNLKQILHN